MVKTFATIAFVLASLVVADSAMAFGHRRGCSGGGCNGGGCPGGVCYAPVAPSKMAATTDAPPGLAGTVSAPAPAATVAQPAYNYSASRRGLFGRR
jgi:hypothetical protein